MLGELIDQFLGSDVILSLCPVDLLCMRLLRGPFISFSACLNQQISRQAPRLRSHHSGSLVFGSRE